MDSVIPINQTYQTTAMLATRKLQKANIEITQLRQELHDLMAQEDFKVISNLNVQIADLRGEIQDYISELGAANSKIAEVHSDLDLLRGRLTSCQATCTKLEVDNVRLRSENSEPIKKEEQLRDVTEALEQSENELSEFKAAASSLRLENAQLKRRIFELTQDLVSQQTIRTFKEGSPEVERLMMQKIDLGQEKFHYEMENAALEQKSMDMTTRLRERDLKVQDLQQELEQIRTLANDRYAEVLRLGGENEKLSNEVVSLQKRNASLEEQLQDRQNSFEHLQKQFAEAMEIENK